MSYRTVNYRDEIISGIGALLNVSVNDLTPETAQRWAMRVNSHVRGGWEYWPFKELEITEQRAYRQVYSPVMNYFEGDEVYFLDTQSYYTLVADAAPNETPATHPEKYSAITNLDRYLDPNQFGKQAIGDLIAAYPCNPRPRHSSFSAPKLHFTKSEKGWDFSTWAAGPTVWITYRPQQPVFTGVEYDPAVNYNAGALVYDPASGDCYRALTGGPGWEISNQSRWYRQAFPYVLAEFVEHMVAGDFAEDAPTKADLRGMAEQRLQREIDKEAEQGVHLALSLFEQDRPNWRYGWSIPAVAIAPVGELCVA